VNFLLKYVQLRLIVLIGLIVGWTSNFLTGLIFLALSIAFPALDIQTCGSYSTLVGFAVALVYTARSDRQQIGSIRAFPNEIFIATICWVVVYLRWHPMATVSAAVAVAVSWALLQHGHAMIGIARNDHFTIGGLFRRESVPSEPASILDSLELAERPELSEADQSRRMRALRAIEEHIEAMKGST
jgi:uncharacterized membrane protein